MLINLVKLTASVVFLSLSAVSAAMASSTAGGCDSLQHVTTVNLTPTQQIANSLCSQAISSPEAYAKAVDALWADEGVQMNHEPPLPSDGLVSQVANSRASIARDKLSYQMMSDYRLEDVDGKVVGTAFWIFYTRVGTLEDGRVMASPIAARFLTKAGKIVDVRLTLDMATLSEFIAAQRAWVAGQKSE